MAISPVPMHPANANIMSRNSGTSAIMGILESMNMLCAYPIKNTMPTRAKLEESMLYAIK